MRTQRPPAVTIASPNLGNTDRFADLIRHTTAPTTSFEAARALRNGDAHRMRARRHAVWVGVTATFIVALLVLVT